VTEQFSGLHTDTKHETMLRHVCINYRTFLAPYDLPNTSQQVGKLVTQHTYIRKQIVLLRTTDVKRKQDGRCEMYQNVRLPQLLQRCASMAVQCSDVIRISHGGFF
jgi:hypothetical protein